MQWHMRDLPLALHPPHPHPPHAHHAPVQPLRIAVVGGRGMPSHYSGVERIWEELYPLLAKRGHHVTVYCRPGVIHGKEGEHRGVRLVTTSAPGGSSLKTLTHTWTSIRHAIRHGDRGQPFDLLALHALPPQVFARMAARRGLPIVSHVHGLDWQRAKWRNTPLGIGARIIKAGERCMVRHASAISACADNLADYYRDAYGQTIEVIPNGVVPDDEPCDPCAAIMTQFKLTAGSYITSIGRIVEEKRVLDSIDAFQKLIADPAFNRYKFAIVGTGDGAYAKSVEAAAATSKGRIVLTGHLTNGSLDTIFRCAAAYITSSELEGLPSSVCEAMERYLPVIASEIPPHRQLLKCVEEHGAMFKVGDTTGAAAVLARVLSNSKLSETIAKAQKQHIRENYAWPVLAQRFESLYLDTVARHRQRLYRGRSHATGPATPVAALG